MANPPCPANCHTPRTLISDRTPRPRGALALWYNQPAKIEKKVPYPSTLTREQKIDLARAKVERYREENRGMPKIPDDEVWTTIFQAERGKAEAEYAKRHMMRSAIKDYLIADYEDHRIYNEIQKRQEEVSREKRKGESQVDTLKRLEQEEVKLILEALKADWMAASHANDPQVKEARAKVAKMREMNETMDEVPDEIIWEKILEEENEKELETLRNNSVEKTTEDLQKEREDERCKRELENRKAEIEFARKNGETSTDTLLRLEKMDEERIRLALRSDWNNKSAH